eukprot:scaffold74854_cov36-Prasinocladus_malaysianus.AAC.1
MMNVISRGGGGACGIQVGSVGCYVAQPPQGRGGGLARCPGPGARGRQGKEGEEAQGEGRGPGGAGRANRQIRFRCQVTAGGFCITFYASHVLNIRVLLKEQVGSPVVVAIAAAAVVV